MHRVSQREFLATAAAGLAMGRGVLAAQVAEAEAVTIMHEAMGQGLTFLDNCGEYHDGKSETCKTGDYGCTVHRRRKAA